MVMKEKMKKIKRSVERSKMPLNFKYSHQWCLGLL